MMKIKIGDYVRIQSCFGEYDGFITKADEDGDTYEMRDCPFSFPEKQIVMHQPKNKEMKETEEIKIVAPEGYEIDEENSTFEKIVFKKKENKFSKNWEEFCEKNPVDIAECYIDTRSTICTAPRGSRQRHSDSSNIPKKFVEPMLALMQLLTIREKEYTKGWEPDWTNADTKYCIRTYNNVIDNCMYMFTQSVLSFPTSELRDEFYDNWKDLLEIAKPLL